MTPKVDTYFKELKKIHGSNSVERIEAMLYSNANDRLPMQEGAKFIVPGLSTTPWLDTKQFSSLLPLINRLEAEASRIKDEIDTVSVQRPAGLTPYEHYIDVQNNWHALYLFKDGASVQESELLVPCTWDIFQNEMKDLHCPLLEVHFSILQPGAVIKPHCDLWNFTINLHLAVEIPNDGCELTVANDTRHWHEGECLLFDYSFLHDAKNLSDKRRVCLLMDIWHPDLTEVEKDALVFVIKEIRKYM